MLADARLGDVVEDQDLVGMAVDEADGLRKMFFENEDVVAKARGKKGAHAGVEVVAGDKVVVWLRLNDMPKGDELLLGSERGEDAGRLWVSQRDSSRRRRE